MRTCPCNGVLCIVQEGSDGKSNEKSFFQSNVIEKNNRKITWIVLKIPVGNFKQELETMKRIIFALSASLALGVQAANYYVSPLGRDANPGTTPEKPLKTIRRALAKTVSGDTVFLKGGLYHELIVWGWQGKNPLPITIKAMPDESPVITFGWRIRGWKKGPGRLFTAPCVYAVRELWQQITLDRYLKVNSFDLVLKQPGGFYQRPSDGMLFVNPFAGAWHGDPEQAGFTVIPGTDGKQPLPFGTEKTLLAHDGMNLTGRNLHVEGLHFAFHSRGGFYMRGGKPGVFYGSGSVRNCTAVGTTGGFRLGWVLDGVVIENCRAIRNSGPGIMVGSYIKNVKVRNNFLLDNGNCPPFYGNYTSIIGNVTNMSRYGIDAEFVDFIGNTILSLDKSRQGGVMRCKSGIKKHTNVLNNVMGGGGVSFNAMPGSTATIDNNTVFPGKFYFSTSRTGEKYHPDLKDNICGGPDWREKIGFVNPEKYDFRLLPSSPFKGVGAFPGPAPVYFAAPGKAGGDGRLLKSPVGAEKLPSLLKSGDTVYFLPGQYTGSFTFRNLKNITLSDQSCGKARWHGAKFEFDNCENVRIDGMDFKDTRFAFRNSTVSFTEVLVENGSFTAEKGKTVFANSRLFKFVGDASGRVVLRENLLDGVAVKASDVISEHNGFAAEAQLKAWPFKETFPSFAAGEKRADGKIVFPVKNLIDGTAGTWIGGRAVKDTKGPLKVENIAVTSLDCGTRALISWTTPEDYVRAEADVFQNGKRVFTGKVPFGCYLSCGNAVCLRSLKNGVPARAELRLYRHNEDKPWKTVLEFTPVKSAPGTPRVLEAGNGKAFKTVAAALLTARPGDTILIAPGTYAEMLDVRQNNITIRAACPGTVKLSAAFMFDYTIRGEDVKGISIENLDFIGLRYSPSEAGVTFMRSEKIKLKNCRFLAIGDRRMGNNHFYGRYLKDVEISNCVFDRGFQGVWIMESTGYVKLDHNTFWGCGVNAVHLAGGPKAELFITNNLFQDVVSSHASPAVSVGSPKSKLVCDWNLYWHTKERCPGQKIFGMGGVLGIHAVAHVLSKDACATIGETRQRYGIEKNGLRADPKLRDAAKGDFHLLPGSPAAKRGSDGKDIGADLSVFAGK